uniref:Uncharacterized protein LOC105117248 n=1 Tax=Rhizophora mucronata TaxID=61149 RepID=A0A2P2IH58_RHIMU
MVRRGNLLRIKRGSGIRRVQEAGEKEGAEQC